MLRKLHWLPALFLGAFLVLLLFGDWVKNLNAAVVEPYGDGFKAYHAILYHARHDSTYSWYEGMNYPYGEHVVPGASQPLLSNGIKLLETFGVPASDYGWGIVNASMLLGLILAVVFTYLLLRRLGISFLLSLAAGAFLTLMAPQVFRIIAHYGLAHPEVLPITLYFLHRWHARPNWQNCLPIAGVVVIFSLIHFYYFAILAFTLGAFLGAHWLISKNWQKWWQYGWYLFLMFGLPAIGFFTWFGLTDLTEGRNDVPFGFSTYQARPLSVFTSHLQPHWQFLLGNRPPPQYEGWAYIGLPAVVFLSFLLLRWGIGRFKRPFLPAAADQSLFLNALLLAGAGLLVFSFGFPINYLGGELLVEKLGPLKQFRSIGRFAWLFYYAIGIALWYWIDRLDNNSSKAWRWGLLALVISVTSLEAVNRWNKTNFDLDQLPDLFEEPLLSEQLGVDFAQFQAVLPIPYYNIGSGNFWLDQSGLVAQKTQIINWQTGLPTTAGMLTRTALWQTLKQLQFVGEPYRPAALLEDFPNDKPLLLIVDTLRWPEFGLRQNHLSRHADLIKKNGELAYFKLPLSAYQRQLDNNITTAWQRFRADSALVARDEWLVTDSSDFFYNDFGSRKVDGFSSLTNEVARAGKNTQPIGYRKEGLGGDLASGEKILNIEGKIDSGHYVFSFWMDISQQRHARSRLRFNLDQTGPWFFERAVNDHLRLLDPNGWALIEIPLYFERDVKWLSVSLTMPLLEGQQFRVDDVLLRPAGLDIFRRTQNELYFNNRYYPLQ